MMPSPCAYRRERNSNHQHPMFVVLCLRHRIVTIAPVAILCPSTTDARKIVGARIPNTTAESTMPTKSVADEDMAYPIGSDRLIREEEAGLY